MVLPAEEAAAERLATLVSDAAIDRMIADARNARRFAAGRAAMPWT